MMTKEEALNKIIEYCKKGSKTPVSDFCRIPCSICPFNDDNCENVIADVLTERLLKAEEHQETNLEHYYQTADIIVVTNINDIPILAVCEHAEKAHKQSETNIVEWLLSPYEEPKPKFKLTQFEYDLLDSANPTWSHENDNAELCDFGYLTRLIDKDYFKGIPTNVPIGDILDNCEVVEE